MNRDMNRVSLSEMILHGKPLWGNTCLIINPTTPSTVIVSLQGIKIAALLQSWSVMVRIMSYPWDLGSLTMKSMAITSNGSALVSVVIGTSFGFIQCVLILLA